MRFEVVAWSDGFIRPDGDLGCEVLAMAGRDMQRNVPVFFAALGPFAHPKAGPGDPAIKAPMAQAFQQILEAVPEMAQAENAPGVDPLQMGRVDRDEGVYRRADMGRK